MNHFASQVEHCIEIQRLLVSGLKPEAESLDEDVAPQGCEGRKAGILAALPKNQSSEELAGGQCLPKLRIDHHLVVVDQVDQAGLRPQKPLHRQVGL